MNYRLLLLCIIVQLLVRFQGLSQNNRNESNKLALQYFEQQEYEKAVYYLEPLYENDPDGWFTYYYKSLLAIKEYTKAEKIVKKQIKRNRSNVFLYVYLARIYKGQGNPKKEKESNEKAIKELVAFPPNVQNLAGAFIEDKQYELALQVYTKGRKATPEYPYFYERAEVYKLSNDIGSMINEYLDALEFRETELQTVQMNLQNSLGYDEEAGMNNPVLKQELQTRIQKSPDKIIFSELLIFILKQQKDFEGAFVQCRALDKRLKEEGLRIYDLAHICVSNRQWETAGRCFAYLLEKGPRGYYYNNVLCESLNVEFLALTQNPQPPQAGLVQLEQKLEHAYQTFDQKQFNQFLLKNLVTLKAYYLNKPAEAANLIENFVKQSGVEPIMKAEFKIMLGDIYILKGDLWDASLLYSQVEKDFKFEPIGHEAKFKNAKMSFYAGEFAWAKAQADILKGATTKLIANDALDLSLIISDALAIDSSQNAPLSFFAGAELMVLQHRFDEAIALMDSINRMYNDHSLGDDIYFKKAQIYLALNKFAQVESMYKSILEFYPDGLYGDDAQFKLAELYENKMNDKEKAGQAYQDVLLKYPGSIFTVEARKRFRDLRGDNLKN